MTICAASVSGGMDDNVKAVFLIKKALNMYSDKLWTPINKLLFALNGVKFGNNLRVKGKVYFFQHSDRSSMVIGDNVYINSSAKANPIGCGERVFVQMVDAGKLIIGNNCGISNCAFTCADRIELEDNVLLGSGCRLYDTDFHALDYAERIKGNYSGAPIRTRPIKICEGAFVGAGSTILKGVTIGVHSIIGAGSVVTKSVPAGEIWAGNPAKFIRKIEDND